ncbi:hypothetical protein WSM22_41000 [Cytophagales bacterium WSM2-2]|nr:hypothetical protein WSM22_41000 [Cytophagales bacterium WSM2-2]
MESILNRTAIAAKTRNTGYYIQVMQVHNTFIAEQEDEYLENGIHVCHVSLIQGLRQIWSHHKQIDAVIVGMECSLEDIASVREVADKKEVPLILHTLKSDWRAKEIAIKSGVDEYHIGFLDQHFIKRIKLIKRVKSFTNATPGKEQLARMFDRAPANRFWLQKRFFDIVISLVILLVLSPILLLLLPALAVETKGYMLSSSKRVGKNFQVFNLYKFKCFVSGEDKKTTVIGKLLYKLHLAGLPQILNVLIGDMSLVGNCPVFIPDAERLTKDEVAWRFSAPVGIVGLWRYGHEQSNASLDCTKLDVEYAMTSTLFLDIRILFFHLLNLIDKRARKDIERMLPSMKTNISSLHFQRAGF